MKINNKNRLKAYYGSTPLNVNGFSLVELLVASALSMIVLIAAGSGFATTQRLSNVANARLQVQQGLRNATNMIVRDARMAGAFGCFNLAKRQLDSSIIFNDYGSNRSINSLRFNNNQNQGVKLISRTDATGELSNFNIASSSVLVFTYGLGSSSNYQTTGNNSFTTLVSNGDELADLNGQGNAPIIIASCSSLDRFVGGSKSINAAGKLEVTGLPNALSSSHNSTLVSFKKETAVFRQIVNVYAVGTPTGGTQGLYLFQLNANGSLGEPQLLLAGVSNWELSFGYSSGCTALNNDAKISFQNSIKTGADVESPTLLRIRLLGQNGNDVQAGRQNNNSESDVQTYHIDATIRGGNACAERSFQQDVKL